MPSNDILEELRNSLIYSIHSSARYYVWSKVDCYTDNLFWKSTDIGSVYNPANQSIGSSVYSAAKEPIEDAITKQLKQYDFRRTN